MLVSVLDYAEGRGRQSKSRSTDKRALRTCNAKSARAGIGKPGGCSSSPVLIDDECDTIGRPLFMFYMLRSKNIGTQQELAACLRDRFFRDRGSGVAGSIAKLRSGRRQT